MSEFYSRPVSEIQIIIISQPIKVDLGSSLELGLSLLFVELAGSLGGLQPITFLLCRLSWAVIKLHHPYLYISSSWVTKLSSSWQLPL